MAVCPTCRGGKKSNFGGMVRECWQCEGKGNIEPVFNEPILSSPTLDSMLMGSPLNADAEVKMTASERMKASWAKRKANQAGLSV